ncbi:MAG TPA: hypothetical protein VFB58_05165 [Chloroflexota bacterium]|nr:hypothetical protein [Chloroflexota bacterium]
MPDFPVGQERFLRQLISTFRCQVCHCGYERDQVRVAARHDELWIVSVRCRRCRNQQVFGITLTDDEADDDLEMEEEFDEIAVELELESEEPVCYDDVLDMHLFLTEFNGDFRRLFRS